MKKLFSFMAILTMALATRAQSVNCTTAVNQLQAYATQVNQIYFQEYWNIIPSQRCPAYDQWGRPYPPAMVQNCRNQMLWHLNNWYGQQSNYVNTMYVNIVRGCTNQEVVTRPAPGKINGTEENVAIDEDEIEELTAGIDEEKAVKITIPKNPTGFRPRN